MLKDSLCRLQHHNQVGEDVADVVVYILRYFFFGKYLGFGAYVVARAKRDLSQLH